MTTRTDNAKQSKSMKCNIAFYMTREDNEGRDDEYSPLPILKHILSCSHFPWECCYGNRAGRGRIFLPAKNLPDHDWFRKIILISASNNTPDFKYRKKLKPEPIPDESRFSSSKLG